MLLYLVKYPRPDNDNPVQELTKVLNRTNMSAYNELLRIIKYVLDTKGMGLQIWPTGNIGDRWYMVCFTDSDYA